MAEVDLVVRGASEIRTCDENIGDGPSGLIRNGALAMQRSKIVWVGPESELKRAVASAARVFDAEGRAVVPGFVDAHTHIVFAGTRRDEFAARAAGVPYSARGILQTMQDTRDASEEALRTMVRNRASAMLRSGTTTIEAKSGYGLDFASEMKLLRVLQSINEDHRLDVEITFLGAHAIPPEFEDRPDGFVREVVSWMPDASSIARWCDVFCDVGAFTPEQSKTVLEAGTAAGMTPRIHANELARSGGAEVARAVRAASADHLIHMNDDDAQGLAAAGCVAVLCPVTALGLGVFPDVELFRNHSVEIALASDFNPGTAYAESLQFAIAIATRAMGIGPEEALIAATRGGASALRRDDIGRLAPGCLADFIVLEGESALDLGYHAGVNLARFVFKRGLAFEE